MKTEIGICPSNVREQDILLALLQGVQGHFNQEHLQVVLDEAAKAHTGMFLPFKRPSTGINLQLATAITIAVHSGFINPQGGTGLYTVSHRLFGHRGAHRLQPFTPAQQAYFRQLAQKVGKIANAVMA